jgi:hypothetical protein
MTIKEKWQQLPLAKRKKIKRIIGVSVGAAAGFAYYAIVGCNTGTCPITSNPWMSTGWGALIGFTATY